jgi:hypothetical protein
MPFAAPTGCESPASPVRAATSILAAAGAKPSRSREIARAADPVCHLAPGHNLVQKLAAVQDDAPYAYRRTVPSHQASCHGTRADK